jgi:hypothetical protein
LRRRKLEDVIHIARLGYGDIHTLRVPAILRSEFHGDFDERPQQLGMHRKEEEKGKARAMQCLESED